MNKVHLSSSAESACKGSAPWRLNPSKYWRWKDWLVNVGRDMWHEEGSDEIPNNILAVIGTKWICFKGNESLHEIYRQMVFFNFDITLRFFESQSYFLWQASPATQERQIVNIKQENMVKYWLYNITMAGSPYLPQQVLSQGEKLHV